MQQDTTFVLFDSLTGSQRNILMNKENNNRECDKKKGKKIERASNRQ